jgi:YHS domain-containing protein
MTHTRTGHPFVGHPMELGPRLRRGSSAIVIAAIVGWLAGPSPSGLAAAAWHGDLASATGASEQSHKPVILIFTAAWSPSCEEFVRTTLPAAEVTAILDACFEPVRLDVDAASAVAKQYGVAHLPTACVLDASGRLLARFECPEQPAEFVRLAASASRETTALAVTESSAKPPVAADQVADQGTGQASPSAFRGPGPAAIPTEPQSGYQASASAFSSRPPAAGAETLAGTPVAPTGTGLPAASAPAAAHGGGSSAFSAGQGGATAAYQGDATAAYQGDATAAYQGGVTAAYQGGATAVASGPAPPVMTGSAFTARAPEQPPMPSSAGFAASGIQSRPFVEPSLAQPAPQQPTPWMGSPAAPQTGALAAQPSQSPTTPYPSAQTGQPIQPATASSIATYSGFPGYATTPPPATGGQPAPPAGQAAIAGQQSAPTAVPETAPAAAEDNPVVSFFRKPFAGFPGWPSRKESTPPQTPSANSADTKTPIVKPAEQALAAATPAPVASRTSGGMPLGLEGYCPVTLREKATWVEGRAQYGACHRGRTYLFAGESEQRTFLGDPDRYAPALSGDDPVMAFDAGRQVAGQRQYGVTYQSRVYLFSSPETQSVFTAAPERYVGRVMVAENPNAAGTVVR